MTGSTLPKIQKFWLEFFPHLSQAVQAVLAHISQTSGLTAPGIIYVVCTNSDGESDRSIATFPGRSQIDIRVGSLAYACKQQLLNYPNLRLGTELDPDSPEQELGAAVLRITRDDYLLSIVGEKLRLEHALAIVYLALQRSGLVSDEELVQLEADDNSTYLQLRNHG